MPIFHYEGVSENGRKLKGSLRANSKQAAIRELQDKRMFVRSVQERALSVFEKDLKIGRAVKLEDFVVFCRQFSTLIRSGVQLDQALAILEDQTAAKHLKRAVGDVLEQVRAGNSLSKGMAEHPRIFPEMFVNMVVSAESAGNLEEVLERMAVHYEKEHKTIQKVKSAMTYPIFVLVIALAVVIFLLVKIVPTFTAMFEEQGAQLPWITRFVVGASHFITGYWWIVLLAVSGIVCGAWLLVRNEQAAFRLEWWKFRIPIFGPVMKKAAIARLTRTLSSLFISAVPVLQALQITERVIGSRVLGKVLRESRGSLEQGRQLSEPFGTSGFFPKMVLQMLHIGEETGQVDDMLGKIADFYEDEVEQSVDRMKSVIEPLMMLFVSGIVGFIVASIMTPMFKMYENFLN